MTSTEKQRLWLDAGYRSFALMGPDALRVESISAEIGKNKSSFYHYFADMEGFVQSLLDYHLEQSVLIAEHERKAAELNDLIEILVTFKTDILFNRQLRIHHEREAFASCLAASDQLTTPAFVPLWSRIIDLDSNAMLSEAVLRLSIENFYLQIDENRLNAEWLKAYFLGIRQLVRQMRQTS
jgi:AcrR family transcriptional regulator